MEYRVSQARGQTEALAAGLCHSDSNAESEPSLHSSQQFRILNPESEPSLHSSQQFRILNPVSKARDGTCVFVDASKIRYPLSHNGNAYFFFLIFYGYTCSIWKFLGQGLNPSHICDLCYNCSNARPFSPLGPANDQTFSSTET